ncbi:DUF5659 domain-containing protein [Bacillus weihaiensis]|uniref:DUF5659 domain-containing protein n=1 Tax=Bacillus weihaiensis TaxID=1547283 RepID=UPI0034DFF183
MRSEKDYVCFSQTMAGFLMTRGCKLKNIKRSTKDNSKFVYYFPNTDYVLNHAEEYIESRK